MCLLVEEPPKRGAKRNKALLAFTFVLFSLSLAFVALYSRNYQLEFIDNRDYPGGPMAWGRTQYGSAGPASGDTIAVVISWLGDGFLVSPASPLDKKIGDPITSPNSYTVAL